MGSDGSHGRNAAVVGSQHQPTTGRSAHRCLSQARATLGEKGGEQAHTLSISELPQHVHSLAATSSTGTQPVPVSALSGVAAEQPYLPPDNNLTALNPATISTVGGSQAHLNMQPFLVLNFCIALQGIFPSQT